MARKICGLLCAVCCSARVSGAACLACFLLGCAYAFVVVAVEFGMAWL